MIRACSWQRLMPFSVSIFVFALEEDSLQQGDYFTSQIEAAIQNNLCTCAHFLCWIQPLYMCPFSLLDTLNQWCLNELLLMLDTNASIILVFYKVKPIELDQGRDILVKPQCRELNRGSTG